MEFFVVWFALSVVAGFLAHTKGRSALGFFFLSLLLSPLVGLIAAAVIPTNEERQAEQRGVAPGKKCPYCAENIKAEARICRFCGREQLADERAITDADIGALLRAKKEP